MAEVDVKFDYDKDADVLYITFGTREPSYCEEIDDILLVERGFITNNITGFRILDVRHHKIQAVELRIGRIAKILKEEKFPFWPNYLNILKQKLEPDRLKNMIYSG